MLLHLRVPVHRAPPLTSAPVHLAMRSSSERFTLSTREMRFSSSHCCAKPDTVPSTSSTLPPSSSLPPLLAVNPLSVLIAGVLISDMLVELVELGVRTGVLENEEMRAKGE